MILVQGLTLLTATSVPAYCAGLVRLSLPPRKWPIDNHYSIALNNKHSKKPCDRDLPRSESSPHLFPFSRSILKPTAWIPTCFTPAGTLCISSRDLAGTTHLFSLLSHSDRVLVCFFLFLSLFFFRAFSRKKNRKIVGQRSCLHPQIFHYSKL